MSKKEEGNDEEPKYLKLENNNVDIDVFKKNISKPFDNNEIKFYKYKNRINGRNNVSLDYYDTLRQSMGGKQSDRNLLNNC